MSGMLRWTDEQWKAHLARVSGRATVRTHKIHDEPEVPNVKQGRPKSGPSELELTFAKQIVDHRLPMPSREFKFLAARDWRLDYAWREYMVAVEVNGMVHRIKERFLADIEKLAYAQMHGWTVLLIAGQDIRAPRGVMWLQTLLEQRGWRQ